MGAEGKMLTRAGWRNAGRCPTCGEPGKDKGAQKAQEKAEFRRDAAEEVALAGWTPDGAWDGVSDFGWVDEPLDDLQRITSRPPGGYTQPPPGWTGPVYESWVTR